MINSTLLSRARALAAWSPLALLPIGMLGAPPESPAPTPTLATTQPAAQPAAAEVQEDVHADVFRDSDGYPSASACASCHPKIYDEWRSSAHAYSGISPMFHRFEQALNTLAVGTVDSFCVRCHMPVGTAVGQPREMSLFEREQDFERLSDPYVALEGVTCVACHRVDQRYGRVNGERYIAPGTIFEPVYGTREGEELERILAEEGENPGTYNIVDNAEDAATEEGAKKTRVHSGVHQVKTLGESEFCMSCHQVAVHPGIKLEVVWDQYLGSPAYEKGISCQDCHMGTDPGLPNGYEMDYRAIVDNTEPIGPKIEHKNHSFVGPGYSIAHPGIFPHRPDRLRFIGSENADGEPRVATVADWLQFAWPSEWGVAGFEEQVAGGEIEVEFPSVWSNREDRENARKVIDENRSTLDARKEQRRQVMENGSHLDGPFFAGDPVAGRDLAFHFEVENTCEGHNLPSGSLGAQPQVWLNVALIDPDGNNIWESGYVDDRGDLADRHSVQVLRGDLEHDDQLFNLQTKFLTTNVKGTDREMYLPVNFDVDQIPFIRPAGVPSTVLNHPPFIRMEAHSLPPLRMRRAEYEVPGELLTKPGTYRMAVRMRSRAEPIYFMDFVGASNEMVRQMNERMVDIHPYAVEFEVR